MTANRPLGNELSKKRAGGSLNRWQRTIYSNLRVAGDKIATTFSTIKNRVV